MRAWVIAGAYLALVLVVSVTVRYALRVPKRRRSFWS